MKICNTTFILLTYKKLPNIVNHGTLSVFKTGVQYKKTRTMTKRTQNAFTGVCFAPSLQRSDLQHEPVHDFNFHLSANLWQASASFEQNPSVDKSSHPFITTSVPLE